MAHSDYMMAVDLRLREIARDMREIMRKVIFVTSHKEKTIFIFHKEKPIFIFGYQINPNLNSSLLAQYLVDFDETFFPCLRVKDLEIFRAAALKHATWRSSGHCSCRGCLRYRFGKYDVPQRGSDASCRRSQPANPRGT